MEQERETAIRRASKDTENFRNSSKWWFWGVDVLGSAALAAITTALIINTLPNWVVGVLTFVVFVFGMAVIYGLIYLWNLFRAPYQQRNEARTALQDLQLKNNELQTQLKQGIGISEKPSPKLIAIYKVLSINSDGLFDCRVFINNKGTESAKHTIVTISFLNIDIISISDGKRIDDLRNKVPTVQWSYEFNVIHRKSTLKILDLKLKIKDINQSGSILSTMYADDMDATANIHTLHVNEMKVIETNIKKEGGSFIKGRGDIQPEVIQLIIKSVSQQDVDKGDSQTQ